MDRNEQRALNARGQLDAEAHAGGRRGLVQLAADHPGFHDVDSLSSVFTDVAAWLSRS